jgi:hypothetical protein
MSANLDFIDPSITLSAPFAGESAPKLFFRHNFRQTAVQPSLDDDGAALGADRAVVVLAERTHPDLEHIVLVGREVGELRTVG